MDTDRVAVARFRADNILTIDQPEHGLITGPDLSCGMGIGNCYKELLPSQTSITLTASAASGYRMTGWTGAAASCGTSSQCTVMFGPASASVQVGAGFAVNGVCTPGATKGCCPCKAASSCCEPGQQTCTSAGQWGSCSGFSCAIHNQCN